MAENVQIDEGSSTSIAADDIAGVKHQRVKIQFGADGSATDVSSSDKLPVATGLTQPTTPSDTQPVSAATLPLPSGAATAANQQTNALTDAQLRATAVPVSGTVTATPTGTQNVDVTANTIGLSTSAKQDTGNTSLSNIDTAIGAKADTSATTDTGTFSLISLFKRLLEKVTTLVAKDFSTETTLSALNTKIPASPATTGKQDTGNTSLSSIDGKLTDVATQTTLALIKAKTDNIPAQGQALAAASTPVVLTAAQLSTLTPPAAITGFLTESDFDTKTGSLTETAPATDTASSGLNGRLQRIAQRLTSIIALLPGSLGQKARAASLAVTLSTEDITALTPPAAITGFATSAKQDTIIGHVDGIETLIGTTNSTLTTIDGRVDGLETLVTSTNTKLDTANTSLGALDNAISGNEMQVDVVAALPAGTNAIGKLAANSGVDIGDVDVTSSVSSTLDHGSNLDIDTTAEQITTTSFATKFGVTVKAAVDNTDTVYIGNSDVTAGTTAATDGFPLEPGESITLPVNNSNLLYAIGAAANQKVFWSAV